MVTVTAFYSGWMTFLDDFLDRRTNYSYNTGYTDWLLSEIGYPAGGYTTYAYNRYADNDYYHYYVTHQRVVDVNLVRHNVFCYTGSFGEITSSSMTSCNEFDQAKSLYTIDFTNGLVRWMTIADAQNNEISKMYLEYNSEKEIVRKDVYAGGSQTVSYSEYYQYDSWGNVIYMKDAGGHEVFYSYAHTDTTGYFVDYNGNIVKEVTNVFIESSVPPDVHTVMVGAAERQGNGNMVEVYHGYTGPDLDESRRVYAPQTTWLTFSGTFNEYTGDTSFLIDLTGHTVVGDSVLQITGLPSSVTYQESHSYTPGYGTGCKNATWSYCSWSGKYYSTYYTYMCGRYPDITTYEGWASLGPFTHYPGTLGYQSFSTSPCNQQAHTFTVTTNWKAYPKKVDYTIDTAPKTITTTLENTTKRTAFPLSDGVHMLSFSESSSRQTRFSWELHVPVDTISDVYTTTYTYDQYGNVTAVTNPQGHTTTYEYSPDYYCAYVTSKTDIVSGQEITVSAAYDFYLGTITSKTCACGSVTDYEYDVLGRLTKIIHPLVMGDETRADYEIVYDDITNTVTLYNENDEKTVRYYDGLNRMVKEEKYTDILWAQTTYEYNYSDKPKQITDPLSRIYQYEYDAVGRAAKFINPDQTYKTLQYDDLNSIVTLTDENQHTKEYTFDWIGNLTSVTEHNNFTYETQYQYDELGNLTQMINAEQQAFTYEYNSFFGITKAVYPDGTEQHFSYDAGGNLTQRIDQNGTTINYTYDAVSRLTDINYQDTFVSFTYNPLGQKTSMVTPDVTNLYHYDERNRLKEVEYVIDNTSYVIQYAYDPVGNVTEITYPDTTTVYYAYFLKDLLESIQGVATFSYYTDGRLGQTHFSNGVTTDYRYDTNGRTQTIHAYTGTNLLDVSYTYDAAGNITHIQNNYQSALGEWITSPESYTYDDVNRLLSASNGFGTILYKYDSQKRLSVDENGQITSYAYDYDVLLSAGTTTYTYDQNGNTLSKSAEHEWVYYYNNANRLTQVDKDGQMFAQYTYNGDGNRIKKVEWSDDVQDYETTYYIYSGINVIYEKNDTGTAMYVYGPSGRIAKKITINNETTTSYYVTDHLRSTRLITDETGNPLTSVAFYPFGNPNNYTGFTQSYLFAGKEQDATGLYYFNARYYDPEIGRFITRDPYSWLPDDPRLSGTSGTITKWLINPQRFDRYTYAQNNPLRYTDPTGLSLECCDPDCTYLCADNAHNTNPGGSQGSPSYPLDPPEDDYKPAEEASKHRDYKPAEETNTEERQKQNRLKDQEECKKECMENEEVGELLRVRRHAKIWLWTGTIGGGLLCVVAGLGGIVPGLVCFGAVLAYTGGKELAIRNLEDRIKNLGCSCVL
jgi:RHS repeat-associated protein